MNIELINSREAFDQRVEFLKETYLDPKFRESELPKTFPCILAWEFWEGDCGRDSIYAYVIEKRHFDNPRECEAFDFVF